MKTDPLKYYHEKYGFESSEIKRIEVGEFFIALILINRQMGICARFKGEVNTDLSSLKNLDLDFSPHRSILTAYYNAKINSKVNFQENADIVSDIIDGNYSSVVMIGYFTSLVKKFNELGKDVAVFDFEAEDTIPLKHQKEHLHKADAVIMTSTAILNGTFNGLINNINSESDIFIVGPSSTLCNDLFEIPNIRKIHGAVFNPEDEKVIDMIKKGKKPKDFLYLAKKVSFSK